jgi:hypothetical protein
MDQRLGWKNSGPTPKTRRPLLVELVIRRKNGEQAEYKVFV